MTDTTTIYDKLRDFFENNPLSQRAAESLKNGVEIELIVDGQSYTFTKDKKSNRFLPHGPSKPDMTFRMPLATAENMVNRSFESIAQVGLFLFQEIASNDESRKVHVKIHSGFLGLMTSGYLGVLASGGADIAKYLATKGLGSPAKIKEAIGKLRG
jgi:hypothetical protein